MRDSRRPWQVHVLIIVIYSLLALALTWPLVTHLGSHVPGNGADDPPLTWNLWWVQHALLTLGHNPFDGTFLFYPLGINLAFYTLTFLNGLLSIPFQATLGLVPASNLLLLSSFVLGGYGTFLLADCLGRRASRPDDGGGSALSTLFAAFLAGMVYAFSSSKLFYAALGQWNITSSQWIPFYVLYLLKLGDQTGRWRYGLMAALFLLFQAYAELTYASFLALLTVLWLVWRFASGWRRTRRATWRMPGLGSILLNLLVIAALLVVGLSPVLAMMLPDLVAEGDIFVEGGGFADIFSADLLGFVVPTLNHPLFRSLPARFAFDYSVGQHLYLGFGVLAAALLGIVWGWNRREIQFWAFSALTFWLLTLGPSLRLNGQDTGLPLPYALVAQLPFFKGNRYPSRYSVLLVLSLALLAAWGLQAGCRRWRLKRKGLCAAGLGLFTALFVFEHISVPLPLSDMRVPALYQTLATGIAGDATLLDLPVAWRNGSRVTGTQDPIIMFTQYYQATHHKRLLAGNTSRNPPLKFQYFTEAPVINTLIALETGHDVAPGVIEQDRLLAPQVLRFFNIQAIVIHPEQAGPRVAQYVEATMPVRPFGAGQGAVAYRVDLPPWPATWRVEPTTGLGRLSYAEGWGFPSQGLIWAQRPTVRLLVPLAGGKQRMSLRAFAPAAGQRLQVELNGKIVDSLEMAAGWSDYELLLPADEVLVGLNDVRFHADQLQPAASIRLSPRTIGQTGVVSPVNLVVHSAGQEVGDFGHIYVNGEDVSPNRRGYNLAVLDPHNGAVLQTAAFDTHLDPGASDALAGFLRAVPEGALVAVSAADEASRLLGQEAVEALSRLGGGADLGDRFRWGHALIGVQGAPPGAALEALDWMRPVSLVVGEGATEPHLAVAFDTITFASIESP